MSTVATDKIAVGDMVELNDSSYGALFKVLDFEVRAGGLVMVKVATLGGGVTIAMPLQRLRRVCGAMIEFTESPHDFGPPWPDGHNPDAPPMVDEEGGPGRPAPDD